MWFTFAAMLSKKTQYALKALSYLAARQDQGPVLITDIAEQKKYRSSFWKTYCSNSKTPRYSAVKRGGEAVIF